MRFCSFTGMLRATALARETGMTPEKHRPMFTHQFSRGCRWFLIGFLFQQAVAMATSALGLIHAHYDIALGPYVVAWPSPPDSFDRLWVSGLSPLVFPMPEAGSGDNGDRGESSGLQLDDRARQPAFFVDRAEGRFVLWRAVRGSVLRRSLGEQWGIIGPVDPRIFAAQQRLDDLLGAAIPPSTLDEMLACLDARDPSIARDGSSLNQGVLHRSVAQFERYFGSIETEPPVWVAPLDNRKAQLNAIGAIELRASAGWGWPFHSTIARATYVWNGTLSADSITSELLNPESPAFSFDAALAWRDESVALAQAVPSTRSDGGALWVLMSHDWIPIPSAFGSVTRVSFFPGIPWKPLWSGAILNSFVYAPAAWIAWMLLRNFCRSTCKPSNELRGPQQVLGKRL